MSRFQTAGISLILIRILRYFTDTQTGIHTATTDIFRQINVIFLIFKGVQSWPNVVFWRFNRSCSCLKGSPNSNETKAVCACVTTLLLFYCYMSRFQTAGISLILIQILRYFTDTQTGIQTATTDIFRQINVMFLIFKGVQSWPNMVLWRFNQSCSCLKGSPNSNETKAVRACVTTWLLFYCYMSQFQTAGISLLLIRILRYFTDTQTGIQTATTDILRQINPIFLFLKGVQSWPHMVFWR